MGLSFVLGALIPIVPYFFWGGMGALFISIALAGATLFGVGAFKGHLAGQSLLPSGLQFLAIAVSAAGFGYLIGLAVQYFFPGINLPT
jgi:predicted membrane protein (TIGR00267 family)